MIDVGLRARKKERTRHELLTVALQLFVQQGFEATTIEHIAAAADVSPRTFFRYFPTKEDVLFGDLDGDAERRTQALVAGLRERPTGTSDAEVLRTVLLSFIRGYEDGLATLLLRKQAIAATPALRSRALQHRSRWEDSVVEALLAARRDGLEPDVVLNTRVTVATTAAAMHAAIEVWLDSAGRLDLSTLIGQAFDHLGAGLPDRPSTATRRPSARSDSPRRSEKAHP